VSYIAQSLTAGEKVVHLGRFHWIYIAGAMLWLIIGLLGCVGIIGGAMAIGVQHSVDVTYPSLPPYLFWKGWAQAVDSHGGYIAMMRGLNPLVRFGAFGFLLLGIALFAHMMIIRATTEIAVTSSRFVLKEGIVARHVDEINIDRIESVHVIQSILGRLLDYGTVMVRGMGVGEIILPPVAHPIVLRKAIDHAKQLGERHEI
jgi:hypothetical protein